MSLFLKNKRDGIDDCGWLKLAINYLSQLNSYSNVISLPFKRSRERTQINAHTRNGSFSGINQLVPGSERTYLRVGENATFA